MDYQGEELEEVLNMFQGEASELLQSIYASIIDLQTNRFNSDAMLQLSRDLHSLKGSTRMLGFFNLQSLAHKMEDVTFLLKENKIQLDQEIIDEFVNIVDYFQILIDETVRSKKEYFTPELSSHLDKLGEFEKRAQKDTNLTDFDMKNILVQYLPQIEAYFVEGILLCLKYSLDYDFVYIEELKNRLKDLRNSFDKIELEENKVLIDDILHELSYFREGERKNLKSVNEKIDNLISNFSELCAQNNVKVIDFKELASRQLNEINSHHDFIRQDEIKVQKIGANVDQNLVNLMKEVSSILSDDGDMSEIDEKIKSITDKINQSEFKKVFKIILKLIKNQRDNNSNDENLFKALSGIISDGIEIFQNPDSEFQDYELLTQRALIIEQMSFIQYSPNAKKETKSEEKQEEGKSRDWISAFEGGAIKTLRVDSQMLDDLGVQVGDLIGTRIKVSEHLTLAKKFQTELEEWQKSWHKVGYYIKYFDRKYLSTEYEHNFDIQTIISYNKQLMSLYNQHSEQISKLVEACVLLNKKLQENDTKLSSVTNILEQMVKNLRILPLATIFHLFPRMVHNISLDQKKNIDFKIEGSEVSADKKIIEDIKIPLIHVIRNSIDHGIETPEERKLRGKSPVGKITISAKHWENKIIIKVSDDGRGIDIEKVKRKIVEMNLVSQNAVSLMSDEEILEYIFTPGFTTESEITDISGRGLGLNIVNNTIRQLNGKINIISDKGRGTDIIIELPVAMATINAFIAQEEDGVYAIPVSSVKMVLRLMPDEIFMKDDNNYFVYEEKMTPIFTLSQVLGLENKTKITDKFTVMLIEFDGARVGIIVDKLIGDQEILHKKLSLPLHRVKNISGVTTLANGETCLILNTIDLIKTVLPNIAPRIISSSSKALEAKNNSNYEIVIIDDSNTTRTLEKKILESRGYRVRDFSNSVDALADLENNPANLIVTDYEMPDMNGIEFIKEIKDRDGMNKIPVILLTSYSSNVWRSDFKEYDFAHVFYKSDFNEDSFVEKIEEVLNESSGNEEN